jgi:hypothetical protein
MMVLEIVCFFFYMFIQYHAKLLGHPNIPLIFNYGRKGLINGNEDFWGPKTFARYTTCMHLDAGIHGW